MQEGNTMEALLTKIKDLKKQLVNIIEVSLGKKIVFQGSCNSFFFISMFSHYNKAP